MQTSNRLAPHLMFLTPVPTAPAASSSARLRGFAGIDYTRIFFSSQSSDWDVLVDMEMMTLALSLDYRLNQRWWIGLDLPLVSMNAGFLDDFVEEFHDTFGLSNYDRRVRSQDDFGYHLRKDAQEWFIARSGSLHLADSRIRLQVALLREGTRRPLSIDFQYILKLPLGEADFGFGSGSFDHGFFMPMQVSDPPWHLYFTPGWVLTGTPDTLGADVEVRPMGSLFLGCEYELGSDWSLLTQLNFYTSPLESTGIRELDEDSFELAIGITRQMTATTALEIAFCEDLSRSAPDFSLHLGLRFSAF